jgi:DNA-binding helix-hairpin-helix protein with protein kinase domain
MTTPATLPNCPVCKQNGQVVKVSHLYLLAREHKQPAQPFSPPSGKREMSQVIHPDMIVGALTLGAIVFLVNIFTQQPNMVLPALIVLVAFYAVYFWKHTWIMTRYQAQKDKEGAQKGNIEAAIGEWMKLYYCGRDKGVFDPAEDELIPLDQMRPYLFRKK